VIKVFKYVILSWGHPTTYCKIVDISGKNETHKERKIKQRTLIVFFYLFIFYLNIFWDHTQEGPSHMVLAVICFNRHN